MLALTLAWAGWVQAQSDTCTDKLRVTRMDGSVVCLNQTSLGAQKPNGWINSLADLVARSVNYTVALPKSEQCVGRIGFSNFNTIETVYGGWRNSTALSDCRTSACDCEIAINSGKEVAAGLWRNELPTPSQIGSPPPGRETSRVPSLTEVAKAELARSEEKQRADAALAEATRLRAEMAAMQQQLAQANSRAAPQSNRKALVIGNDRYQSLPKLRNAGQDARLLSENLRKVGYRVSLQLDQTEKQMKATLRQFKNTLDPGDEVVVFYAGHGVQLAGANYLIPVDTVGDSEDAVRDESIAVQRVLDDIAERRAQVALIILDACRDNPFRQSGRSSIGGARGLAPTSAATGQMIVYSAGIGQQALDSLGPKDTEPNSVFTRVFVREMHKPGLSLDKIVRNVRSEVVSLARSINHEQVPAIYDQVIGEFFFIKP